MFRDLWDQRLAASIASEKAIKSEMAEATKQSEALLERIVATNSLPVITAYERKIEKLERRKLVLSEKLATLRPAAGRFDQMFELAWKFLANPCKIWGLEDFAIERTVLRLAFSEPLAYDRKEGYRTPKYD